MLQTTRSELFSIFAPYGFIKSCWLKMGDRGPNRPPTPTYAFVTFSNPEDAHKYVKNIINFNQFLNMKLEPVE